jgi:hypothetical protein
MSDETQSVRLALTADEALVLFELVSRFGDSDQLTIADQAEATILWKLCGQLEALLTQPFSPKYSELLSGARQRVRGDAPAAGD